MDDTNNVCCVPGCGYTLAEPEPGIKLHRFPSYVKESKRFQLWLNRIGNDLLHSLQPSSVFINFRICSAHFIKDSNSELVMLAPSKKLILQGRNPFVRQKSNRETVKKKSDIERAKKPAFSPGLTADIINNASDAILLNTTDDLQELPTCEDYSKICRICMNKVDHKAKSIHDHENKFSLRSLLEEYTKLKIPAHPDGLPQHFCYDCVNFLLEMHTFKSRCYRNDFILKILPGRFEHLRRQAMQQIDAVHDYAMPKFDDHVNEATIQNVNNYTQYYNQIMLGNALQVPSAQHPQQSAVSTDHFKISLLTNDPINYQIELSVDQDEQRNGVKNINGHPYQPPVFLSDQVQIIHELTQFEKIAAEVAHEKVGIFQCSKCVQHFPDGETRQKHYLSSHSKYGIKRNHYEECPFCHEEIHKYDLQKHLKNEHPENQVQCIVCKEWCLNKKQLKEHLSTHSRLERFLNSNPGCYKKTKMKKKMQNEGNQNEDAVTQFEDDSICLMCNHGFLTKADLIHHCKNLHGADDEGNVSKEKSIFEIERWKQILKKARMQDIKVKPFGHIGARENLMYNQTALGGHLACGWEECDLKFANLKFLRRHRMEHTKKLFCGICSKAYSTKDRLRYHILSHTEKHIFQCSHCTNRFYRVEDWKRHLTAVHHITTPANIVKEMNVSLIPQEPEEHLGETSPRTSNSDHLMALDLSFAEDEMDITPENIQPTFSVSTNVSKPVAPKPPKLTKKINAPAPLVSLNISDKTNQANAPDKKPYKCHKCHYSFSHLVQWKRHLKFKHDTLLRAVTVTEKNKDNKPIIVTRYIECKKSHLSAPPPPDETTAKIV